MRNISFDNPYFLLIAIPLIALIIVPYAIAIRKDNKSKSVIASLVLHIIIAVLITLGIAGTAVTNVITETEVIVVADVSYSSNPNLDTVDEYIQKVKDTLPENSKMSIVAFGKDYVQLTGFGEEIKSVKDADIDDSATDISGALNYASTLFNKDGKTIKRVVLITDGKQTDREATGKLINSIEALYAKNVDIDAMYLDNNITEDAHEVQISGVEYTQSTYIDHDAVADVLLQSNQKEDAVVTLYVRSSGDTYKRVSSQAVTLDRGYNIVNLDLPTAVAGEFDYKVSINCETDTSEHNNDYLITQKVSDELKVLAVVASEEEAEAVRDLYAGSSTVDIHIINSKTKDRDKKVPYRIEDICKYDEIMISGVDVRLINNYSAFLVNVEKAVSLFGKSLVTAGDTKIQNKTDDTLKALEDMLPVRFGNDDQDKKYIGIVIDCSRSMETLQHFTMAKQAAMMIVDLLEEGDIVTVASFAGESFIKQVPIEANGENKAEIKRKIDEITTRQGTLIGAGLNLINGEMQSKAFADIENKQVFLLSDGMSYSGEPDTPQSIAREMYASGVVVSSILMAKGNGADEGASTMKKIAAAGGGQYYDADSISDLASKMNSEIADNITESVVEKPTKVEIVRKNNSVFEGVNELSDIYGFVYGKVKASADTLLVAKHQKAPETVVDVPVYASWEYGNGRVSTLTTTITGEWIKDWSDGVGRRFLYNILGHNIPEEKVDYPFTLNVEYDGKYTTVEIVPAIISIAARVEVTLESPNGKKVSETLVFDSEKYFHSFETPDLGKYKISVTYTEKEFSYTADSFVNLSYSPEYDSFAVFNASTLYEAIRDRGRVIEDGNISIENDEMEVTTYTIDFTVPFLIAAIVLYIIDIIVRKIKWNDIKSLFKKKRATTGGA